jgi:hypothetical protein
LNTLEVRRLVASTNSVDQARLASHFAALAERYTAQANGGRFFPTVRAEYFSDSDGFATGVAQKLWGFTFTADTKLGADGSFAKVLLRPEIRYDRSDEGWWPISDNHERCCLASEFV